MQPPTMTKPTLSPSDATSNTYSVIGSVGSSFRSGSANDYLPQHYYSSVGASVDVAADGKDKGAKSSPWVKETKFAGYSYDRDFNELKNHNYHLLSPEYSDPGYRNGEDDTAVYAEPTTEGYDSKVREPLYSSVVTQCQVDGLIFIQVSKFQD